MWILTFGLATPTLAESMFITRGIDATAEAGTMIGDEQKQLALRVPQGCAVFVLTQKGWKVSARLSGTKYWPDAELN